MRADHGFEMKNNIVVRLNNSSPEALKTELSKHPNILNVSASSHVPASGATYGDGFKNRWTKGMGPILIIIYVDQDYLGNLNVPLITGRYFSADAGLSNKNFIVINEQAVKAFHFATPAEALGQQIIYQKDSSRLEIIA